MTTPQRALELAREIARKLDPHFPAQELSDFEKALACQALYHYAEIMQAETELSDRIKKAYYLGWDRCHERIRTPSVMGVHDDFESDAAQLIIKPKPLP